MRACVCACVHVCVYVMPYFSDTVGIYEGIYMYQWLRCECNYIQCKIVEAVDSICRDGADTPIRLNKSNSSELPNADVLGLKNSDQQHTL